MKIDIENPQEVLSHIVLENRESVDKIIETKEFKENGELNAVVFVNGVEIPGEIFEQVMNNIINQVEQRVREKYNAPDIDEMVNTKTRETINEIFYRIHNEIEY
jgi:hypothetical protein